MFTTQTRSPESYRGHPAGANCFSLAGKSSTSVETFPEASVLYWLAAQRCISFIQIARVPMSHGEPGLPAYRCCTVQPVQLATCLEASRL